MSINFLSPRPFSLMKVDAVTTIFKNILKTYILSFLIKKRVLM